MSILKGFRKACGHAVNDVTLQIIKCEACAGLIKKAAIIAQRSSSASAPKLYILYVNPLFT